MDPKQKSMVERWMVDRASIEEVIAKTKANLDAVFEQGLRSLDEIAKTSSEKTSEAATFDQVVDLKTRTQQELNYWADVFTVVMSFHQGGDRPMNEEKNLVVKRAQKLLSEAREAADPLRKLGLARFVGGLLVGSGLMTYDHYQSAADTAASKFAALQWVRRAKFCDGMPRGERDYLHDLFRGNARLASVYWVGGHVERPSGWVVLRYSNTGCREMHSTMEEAKAAAEEDYK